MSREVLIIPDPDSGIIVDRKQFSDDVYRRILSDSERHGIAVREFSNQYQLGIDFPNNNGYKWSTNLAILGHLSVQIDQRDMILFLPVSLSQNQMEWFHQNKKSMSRFSISFVNLKIEDSKLVVKTVDRFSAQEKESTPLQLLKEEVQKKSPPQLSRKQQGR